MEKYKVIDKGDGVKLITYFSEHWYKTPVSEDPFKSVSMILSVIDKGKFFADWLKTNGPNADYITKRASISGTKLHDAFEKLTRGETINVQDDVTGVQFDLKEWKKVIQFADWFNGIDIQPLCAERSLFSEKLDVAGTADLVAKISGTKKHDGIWLLDYKTGNYLYETSKLQVAVYAIMWNEMVDSGHIQGMPKIERAGLVHIGAAIRTKKDIQNVGVKVEEIDIEEEYKNFEVAVLMFNRFNPGLKAPISEFPMSVSLTRKIESNT